MRFTNLSIFDIFHIVFHCIYELKKSFIDKKKKKKKEAINTDAYI